MPYHFLEVAVTPSVRAAQANMGVEQLWLGADNRPSDILTEGEIAFIASRDSFYIASVSETGWPYVQHRGGKTGFLKVVDHRTLAFADYRGNRQYISAGNFAANDRACLFLMDYVRRARLKIYAYVERLALDADQELTELVSDPTYKGRAERIFRLRLEAFDWNCPQHIIPRYTEQQVEQAVAPLREQLQRLETENATLRARLENPER
ncbi:MULTISPECIES: pyridoxamine 5'-phosphate oxidase family protein [Rhizobium]|jgi:predicted pyridoxine 5'-phosphate oxidase superfamily flavin-nucleotide-binding protein|uniref:Pyridoxamine 5-phosphate oxidase n=1 Tax=Rhizobium nepotum 39/7 TaxID=1368418 RepID=A0ABR5CS34_9HYPH|nr:pyridoxamine 5'-phosphate oxidase family protein [Rhizobium nepotum]KJF67600.1 pyridoxamine 5-phosphate oxidase [Rhizobium nepotum 39/7]